MNPPKVVALTLGGLLLVAAIILGGWEVGWWFRAQNVDRTYQVNTHSQGYIAAEVDHLRDLATGYDATTDPGQRAQIRAQFCAIYADLGQQPPADIVQSAAHVGC